MKTQKPPNQPVSWFLIRGLGREHGHWGEFPEILKEKHRGSEVVFMDLPGTGDCLHEKSPASISGIVDYLRAKRPGVERRERVGIGLSLGGMVLLDWVLRYPEDWDRVGIINSSVASGGSWMDRMRWDGFVSLLSASFLCAEEREKIILARVSNSVEARGKVLESWVQIAKERPVKTVTLARQIFAAMTYRPKFEKEMLKGKVMLLASTKDRLTSYRSSQAISQATGWPLYLHAHAGHDLPLDDPDWVSVSLQA
jgi:pimeloyl-ACP methyl ester carboxylesterase